MTVRVDLRELIHFYDSNPAARTHANAVKTLAGEELNLAVLTKYFADRNATVKLLDGSCTTGHKKGPRLDAWLRVTEQNVTYYQVEAKAWSFHGYGGGTPLAIEHDPDHGRRVRIEWWQRYWDGAANKFKHDTLNKVLIRMKPPTGAGEAHVVEPLACLWTSMHPTGEAVPLFSVPVSATDFKRVWIFAVSTFLRECLRQSPFMELPLEHTKARLRHLARLFPSE